MSQKIPSLRCSRVLRRWLGLFDVPCGGVLEKRGATLVCDTCGETSLAPVKPPAPPAPPGIGPRPRWIAEAAKARAREALVGDAVKNRGTNTSIAEG